MYTMKYFEFNLNLKNTMFILNFDFKVHFKVPQHYNLYVLNIIFKAHHFLDNF